MLYYLFLSLILNYADATGVIFTKDIILNFCSVGYLSKMTLPFQLTNPLNNNEFLFLSSNNVFHKTINAAATPYTGFDIPKGLTVTWGVKSECDENKIYMGTNDILYQKEEGGIHNYILNFSDYSNKSVVLSPTANYFLEITITDLAVLADQQSSSLIQFSLTSRASFTLDSFIYDINNVAYSFKLYSRPTSSQTTSSFSFSFEDRSKSTSISSLHTVYLDIFNNHKLEAGGYVLAQITDNSFKIQGGCTTDAKSTYPQIPVFLTSFSCNIDTSSNQLIFKSLENFEAVRLKFQIKNPSYVPSTSTYVKVMISDSKGMGLEEYTIKEEPLVILPLSLDLLRVDLGWGVDPTPTVLLPFSMKVVRATLLKDYVPFNSFFISFKMKQNSPEISEGMSNKLILSLKTDSNEDSVLAGSIFENLPRKGEKVSCQILDVASKADRRIECTNLGRFLAGSLYKINFRMSFIYDQFETAIQISQSFGVISIQSYSPAFSSYYSLLPSYSPTNVVSLLTTNGKNWLPTSSLMISSFPLSSSATPVDPSTIASKGVRVLKNENQRIVFNLKTQYNDVNPTVGGTANTNIVNGAGIFIFVSPNVKKVGSTQTFEDSTGSSHASIKISVEDIPSLSSNSLGGTLIKYSATNSDGLLLSFASIAADLFFSIKNFEISNGCPMEEKGYFDAYIISMEQIEGTSIEKKVISYNLLNGFYTCDNTKFTTFKPFISNFWTGQAGLGHLDGEKIVSLLIFKGKLSSIDAAKSKRLVIFFSGWEGILSSMSQDGSNYVTACNGTNIDGFCYGYNSAIQSTIPQMMNKIEFTLKDPFSDFTLILPFRTVENKVNLYYYLALLNVSSNYDSSYPIVLAFSDLSKFTFAASTPALSLPFALATITNLNYGLDVNLADRIVGKTMDININIGHSDPTPVISPNDASNKGSGFTYISSFNLIGDKSIVKSPFCKFQTDVCISFQYWFNNEDKFGLWCPFCTGDSVSTSSQIKIENAVVPSKKGSYIDGYGMYSLKTGELASLKDEPNIILNKGEIKIVEVDPYKIYSRLPSNRWKITFQTTNPLYSGNYIRIAFNSNIRMNIDSSAYCLLFYPINYKNMTTKCTINYDSIKFISYKIEASPTILPPATFVLYHYGLETINFLSGLTFKVQTAYSLIDDNKYIIDESKEFQILFENATNLNISTSANLSNINLNTLADLNLSFKLNGRPIFENEYVCLDLASLYSDSEYFGDLNCQIYEESLQISTNFRVINYKYPKVYFQPKRDLNMTKIIYILCDNLRLKETAQKTGTFIKISVVAKNDYYITQPTILNLTTISPVNPFMDLSIKEIRWTSYFSPSSITFQIQLDLSLNSTMKLILVYPRYYHIKLNPDSMISCFINDVIKECQIVHTRKLVIDLNSVFFQPETTFLLKVVGAVRSSSSKNFQFFLALTSSYSLSYLQSGFITDSDALYENFSPIQPVTISSFSLTPLFSRETTTINYIFGTPLDLFSSDLILIDFPPSFLKGINGPIKDAGINGFVFSPVCYLTKLSYQQKNNLIDKCIFNGNKLILYPSVNLVQGQYQLAITSMYNPFYPSCIFTPQISLSYGADMILAKSFGYLIEGFNNNGKGVNIEVNKNKTFLGFRMGSAEIKEVEVYVGFYSDAITIYNAKGYFSKETEFLVYGNDFITYPNTLKASIGDDSITFRIAAKGYLEANTYVFALSVNPSSYYTLLPAFSIKLMNKTRVFPLDLKSQSLELDMINYPIYQILDNVAPTAPLLLNFSIDSDIGIIFNDINFINLTIDKPVGKITLSSFADENNLGKSTFLKIKISENNNILGEGSIPISIKKSVGEELKCSLEAKNFMVQPNSITILSSCGTMGELYYEIIRERCAFYNLTNFIYDYENYQLQVPTSTRCPTQSGSIVFQGSIRQIDIALKNLGANTFYKMRGVCKDFRGNTSISEINFTTPNNDGKLVKMKFTFSNELNFNQKENLACYLINYFNIPLKSVQTLDGIYCQKSRSLQTTTNVLTLQTNTSSISHLYMYFLPLSTLPKDDLNFKITTIASNIDFIKLLQNNVPGLPSLLEISAPIDAIRKSSSSSKPNYGNLSLIGRDLNWAAFNLVIEPNTRVFYRNFQMNNSKYIYNYSLIVSYEDILSGEENIGDFEGIENKNDIINFTNLKANSSYVLGWFVAEENPSWEDAWKSNIYSLWFNTTHYYEIVISWGNIIGMKFNMLCLIVIFLIK